MDLHVKEADADMDPEERIRWAFEECKKGGWVRNPFAGTFGDFAPLCIEMADGSCRWETIDMRRRAPEVAPGGPTGYEAS